MLAYSATKCEDYSQLGYKYFKSKMSQDEAQKLSKFSVKTKEEECQEKIEYYIDGGECTWNLVKYPSLVKIEGAEENLLGKSVTEIKKILGKKLVAVEFESDSSEEFFIYYHNTKAKKEHIKSCVLYFNAQAVLESIMAVNN